MSSSKETSSWYDYWSGGVAIVGGFLQSYVACVIAGALSFIAQEFHLSPLKEGWIASAILLGALVGSVCSGYLADKLGRRTSLQLSALLFFFTGVGVFFANSFFTLLLIRLLSGFAAGMTSLLVPLYLGEIAPASKRGAFVTAFTLAVTVGTLIAYLANYALASSGNWRLMLSLGAVPAALQFVAFFFLPQGKTNEKVLSIPRGSEESGIGQGGSPDFLAGARGIAKGKTRSEDKKYGDKADAGQNRLFNHERYKRLFTKKFTHFGRDNRTALFGFYKEAMPNACDPVVNIIRQSDWDKRQHQCKNFPHSSQRS